MQIQERDLPAEIEQSHAYEPRLRHLQHGFLEGLGFAPSSVDEDETLTGTIEFDQNPEELDEKDCIGDDTRPRR